MADHEHEWDGGVFSGYTDHYEGNTEDIYWHYCMVPGCTARESRYVLR